MINELDTRAIRRNEYDLNLFLFYLVKKDIFCDSIEMYVEKYKSINMSMQRTYPLETSLDNSYSLQSFVSILNENREKKIFLVSLAKR